MIKRLTALSGALALILAASVTAFAQAPVYNWTGWYAGVNAGASMGNVKTDFNVAPVVNNPTAQYPFTPNLGFSDREAPSGFIGGGQIGYNWQYSPLIVVGLEADIQGALERDTTNNLTQSFSYINPVPPAPGEIPGGCGALLFGSPPPCTSVTNYTTQIDWFGTVRARLGYVWGNGEVLSYITGGLAYGEVKINGTNTVSGFKRSCGCDATGPFINGQTFGQSHVNTGWVLGYGTEGHLPLMPGNWTWKVETLYMDLGTLDTASVTSIPWDLGNPGGQVTMHTHFTDWVLRGGLNYQFH